MLADNYGNLVHRATVLAKKDAGGAPPHLYLGHEDA